MVYNTKADAQRRPEVFGRGSEDIIRVNWECTGDETKLADCPFSSTTCLGPDVRNSAGVHCFGNKATSYFVTEG